MFRIVIVMVVLVYCVLRDSIHKGYRCKIIIGYSTNLLHGADIGPGHISQD
jgi:hypothetical protein